MPASAPARLPRANSLALSPRLLRSYIPLFRSHLARFDQSSEHALEEGNGVARPEVGDLGLVGSTGHARVANRSTQGLHLVVGLGVFDAGKRRWPTSAKLFVEVHRERFDGTQPRCGKRRERRRRWPPLASSRAAEIGRRWRLRIASVIGRRAMIAVAAASPTSLPKSASVNR